MRAPTKQKQFTGWHMLAILIAFFGTIIGVNVTLAVFASTSWSGLVVKNSYVASQEFDERQADARAQAALKWSSSLTQHGDQLIFELRDASGKLISNRRASILLTRPSHEQEDVRTEFEIREGQLVVPTPATGRWKAYVVTSGPGPAYKMGFDLMISPSGS